jgi:aconitase A
MVARIRYCADVFASVTAILTSFNRFVPLPLPISTIIPHRTHALLPLPRNFKARNDANSKTMNFLASPEIVTAMTFAGRLSFNPLTDTLTSKDGRTFKFDPPSGSMLPEKGFTPGILPIGSATA